MVVYLYIRAKMKKYLLGFYLIIASLITPIYVLAEPPNLAQVLNEVVTYHDSGSYQSDITNITNQAQTYILKRVNENKASAHPQKLAIILDIDETSVSNYEKMSARRFISPTMEQLRKEILEGNAPVISSTLMLYREAIKNGVSVFFVTGRWEFARAATEKNLKLAGYQGWKELHLRPDNYSQHSIVAFKAGIRKAITEKGYKIIASIGDQKSDILGGYTEKGFKLPNPYYYLP
jgi:acid phosphatase